MSEFSVVKAGIIPFPLADKPRVGLLFVHAKLAPLGMLVKLTDVSRLPGQATWFKGLIILGLGFMVMTKFSELP